MNSWSRQYTTPTMDSLLGQLGPEPRAGLELLRKWSKNESSIRPKLSYAGLSWRWSEGYEFEPQGNSYLRGVHLIPDPDLPRVAVCCDRRFFDAHPLSQLPRTLHTGLGDGVCIADQAWCVWGVGGPDSANSLIELIELMRGQ